MLTYEQNKKQNKTTLARTRARTSTRLKMTFKNDKNRTHVLSAGVNDAW